VLKSSVSVGCRRLYERRVVGLPRLGQKSVELPLRRICGSCGRGLLSYAMLGKVEPFAQPTVWDFAEIKRAKRKEFRLSLQFGLQHKKRKKRKGKKRKGKIREGLSLRYLRWL